MRKRPTANETSGDTPKAQPQARGHVENIDAEERLAASKLRPAKDPVLDEIYAFRLEVRKAYNNRSFDKLEQMAADIRQKKEVFDNGSWKIAQFYAAFECRDDEPESMWKLHDEIHRAWIEAKPASIKSKASWPKTKAGLRKLREKYPRSLSLSVTAQCSRAWLRTGSLQKRCLMPLEIPICKRRGAHPNGLCT